MIFMVTRTSLHGYRKPYDKCFPIKLTRVDKRYITSVEEYDKRFTDKWMDNGTNHRVLEDGYIARDVGEEECYGIEINSLEELMQFYKDVDSEIVLGTSYIDHKTPYLEIYDDYRE